jgi:hypothetical protein
MFERKPFFKDAVHARTLKVAIELSVVFNPAPVLLKCETFSYHLS